MEKRDSLNTQSANVISKQKEDTHMDLGAYFQILVSVLMTGTFVTLTLIFLDGYYGKEEEKEED